VPNATAELPSRDFTFFAGHPALDLCATLTGRLKPQPQDLLVQPQDLAQWLVAAGVAAAAPAVGRDDVERARVLRECVYALALARTQDERLPAAPRRALNGIAAGKSAVPKLGADASLQVAGSARQFLVSLAREALRLLASPARIRQCEAVSCARLFIDTSRSGERRWCSMSACGNKAKVAQFRRRQLRQRS